MLIITRAQQSLLILPPLSLYIYLLKFPLFTAFLKTKTKTFLIPLLYKLVLYRHE